MQHHGAALRELTGSNSLPEELVRNWRAAEISPRLHAILEYAVLLTNKPSMVRTDDIAALRQAGLSDEAVLHVAEITSYFNFVNRLADGLGVRLEEDWPHPIIVLL